MAQIVINIDNKTYKVFMELMAGNLWRSNYKGIIGKCLDAIKHGKVLPKGHGRLIDADKFLKDNEAYTGWILNSSEWGGENAYKDTLEDLVNEAPAITEQEIAKPYLEKLKTEIEKKHTKAKQTSSVLQMNAYTDCLQMIDNLLSEQETK